jgi:hypothetical protein
VAVAVAGGRFGGGFDLRLGGGLEAEMGTCVGDNPAESISLFF